MGHRRFREIIGGVIMTDLQICMVALSKMPWLLIIPIAILVVGLHEAIEREWDRRFE